MHKPCVRFTSFIAPVLLFCSAAVAQTYTLHDLGENVFPAALNDSLVVVGNVNDSGVTPPTSFPFVWANGALSKLMPAGWTGGSLQAINASGVAVGQAVLADPSHPTAPFVYQGGTISSIPVDGIGSAGAINDAGVIGGFVQPVTGSAFGPNAPFVYQGGTVTVLSTAGVSGGGVNDINKNDVAVGSLSIDFGLDAAFSWQGGTFTVLPAFGNFSSANAVNDAGVIVGGSNVGTEFFTHLVVWENGMARDLGQLATGMATVGMDINNDGVIVGSAFGLGGTQAFRYDTSGFQALDTLAASSGWHFVSARAINRNGDIVGFGTPPNATAPHGYLLVAQRTPQQLAILLNNAIAAAGLTPSQAQSLVTLLTAYSNSGGANQQGLCNSLARFVRNVPGYGLPPAQASTLIDLATQLSTGLGC